ncbi:bacterioferritin, iron storage and detoxification protein [Candidatus Terasakiella magnetica]|nr:bacterioferritin, iron storage and detoxification protein [Candidatus Terasakiella magnetica]
MKGKKNVITRLNALLVGELVAANQYFVHARMYHEWGLHALWERIEHERQDEIEHADKLIRRILFLEGTPDIAKLPPPTIGKDVVAMLKADLALEYEVVAQLKEAIAHCEESQDYDTRRILVDLLDDTEQDHAHWLEQQLGLIERIGLQNYQQSAMGRPSQGA